MRTGPRLPRGTATCSCVSSRWAEVALKARFLSLVRPPGAWSTAPRSRLDRGEAQGKRPPSPAGKSRYRSKHLPLERPFRRAHVNGQEHAVDRPVAPGRAMVLEFVWRCGITLQCRDKGRVRHVFSFSAPGGCQGIGSSNRCFKGGGVDKENVGNAIVPIVANGHLPHPAGVVARLEDGVVGGDFPGS